MSSKAGLFLFTCVIVCVGAAAQAAKGQSTVAADTPHVAASAEPFLGKWKLNPAKSKLSDEMRVDAIEANKYAFDFGTGKRENIVTDGTDQQGEFGTTLAVTVEGPHLWKVVRKMNGRMLISAHWELSSDGETLTDHFTGYKPDGSANPTENYEYRRTAGSAGFAGVWESTMQPKAFEVQIKPFEGDGLSFVNSDQKSTRNIKFDGKDYPSTGPNYPAGATSAGHPVGEHAFDITEKVGGEAVDTQEAELSPDGKVLTMTVHLPSQSKPKIYVFERE